MNNIIHLNNSTKLTMSSREIAELTGKQHKDVRRDIRSMLENLGEVEIGAELHTSFTDSYGRKQPEYLLNKELTMTLITGYRTDIRHKVVRRWLELEKTICKPSIPNFDDPIEAARAWIEARERSQIAEQKIVADAPKVAFVNNFIQSTGSMGFRDAFKSIGLKPTKTQAFVREELGWITKTHGSNVAYTRFVEQGLVVNEMVPVNSHRYTGTALVAKITPKGLMRVSEMLRVRARTDLVAQKSLLRRFQDVEDFSELFRKSA